jgi:carbonic anhydrase
MWAINTVSSGEENDSVEDSTENTIKNKNRISPRAPTFTYGFGDSFGPPNWSAVSSNCAGTSQSPIDIQTLTAQFRHSLWTPLRLNGATKKPTLVTAQNNGHAFVIKFTYSDGVAANFTGGPLTGTYIVDNIHWHWGEYDQGGSEHTVNGRQYAAEGHVVSWNSKYGLII